MLYTGAHFLERVGLTTEPIHLSPARNAWLDVMTSRESGDPAFKHLIVPDGVRTWSDNRHVPPDDIEELREFVDVRSPQYPSYARDSRIIPGYLTSNTLRARYHRAKL